MTEPQHPPAGAGAEPGPDHDRAERNELAAFYRLDPRQADALADLLGRFEAVEGAGPDEGAAAAALGDGAPPTLAALADPAVAAAFVSQAIGIRTDRAPALARFSATAAAVAPATAAGACAWLEGRALSRLGHAELAAGHLDRAVVLDPHLGPALVDAAALASERGDADRALELARAAGLGPDDELVALLTGLIPPTAPDLGRNDPCPCGSGRKYKHCHLGRRAADLGLEARAGWLYRKGLAWLTDTVWRLRLIELAGVLAGDPDDEAAVLRLALGDPSIADLAFAEDGAWAAYVAERGVLLPDDERQLADRWTTVARAVHAVVAVDAGRTVVLAERGAPDADAVTVRDPTLSRLLSPGELVVARVLPAGRSTGVVGGAFALAPEAADEVAGALAAGPTGLELARILAGARPAPPLANTEGEPLIHGRLTVVAPGGAPALAAALDADPDLRRAEGTAGGHHAGPTWLEVVEVDGREWVRARYGLDGDHLVVEANSQARLTRARRRVEGAVAGVRVVDAQELPVDHLAGAAPPDPRPRTRPAPGGAEGGGPVA